MIICHLFRNRFIPLDFTNPFLIFLNYLRFHWLRTAPFEKCNSNFSNSAFSSSWNLPNSGFSTWDSTHLSLTNQYWSEHFKRLSKRGYRLFHCTLDSPFTMKFYFFIYTIKAISIFVFTAFLGSNFPGTTSGYFYQSFVLRKALSALLWGLSQFVLTLTSKFLAYNCPCTGQN